MLPPLSTNVSDQLTDQPEKSNKSKRLPWLDMAKAYGMFLVYYGHFVEKISEHQGYLAETVAYKQYKLIYAFHMPLFFILSGFVYKHKEQPIGPFVYQKLLTRVVPALFFNFVAIGIYFVDHLVRGNGSFAGRYPVPDILVDILTGYPFGNFLTWFLFCLFTVELLNYFAYPLLKGNLWKHAGLALLTLIVGYYLGLNQSINSNLPFQGFHTWYFNEALVGFSFFQVGFILRQSDLISWFEQSYYRYIGLGLTLIITVATFNLNQGPFLDPRGMVALALTSYGNLLLFPITALTGSLFVILLSLSLPSNKATTFIGKNTLILLGMNFFFMDIAKPMIGKIGLPFFEPWLVVTLFCIGLTIVSFMVTVPLIQLLHRFVPQLMGRPKVQGPLIPALLR